MSAAVRGELKDAPEGRGAVGNQARLAVHNLDPRGDGRAHQRAALPRAFAALFPRCRHAVGLLFRFLVSQLDENRERRPLVRAEVIFSEDVIEPTDAVIRLSATCICGSDLWPFRGLNTVSAPMAMGHEYCGVVEEVGAAVKTVRPGQFVVGSFCISDNTCPHCRAGYQTSCAHRQWVTGAQAPLLRVPMADGTLVATPAVKASHAGCSRLLRNESWPLPGPPGGKPREEADMI